MAKRFLDENGLDALWGLIKAAVNTLLEKMDGKADVKHTHLYVGIEDHASMSFDNENVYIRDAEYTPVIKVLNPEGNACGVQISSNLNEHWQLGIEDGGSYLQSPNGRNMVVVQDDALRLKHLGTDTTGGTDVNLRLDMTNNIIEIKQPGKSGSAFKAKTDETSVKFNDSMGLRLKADQSELKFSGKGITVTKTETKVTSAGAVVLIAPSIEARDNSDNPIFLTERKFKSGTTTDEQQTHIFVGNKEYHTGDGTSAEIVLNGDIEVFATLQTLKSIKRSRFEMPMTIDWIKQDGQLLSKEMCKYLYSAIYRYIKISINSEDFVKEDEASLMLRQLSGENIYPVILSKYWFDGYAQAAHAQHFKPWLVEFYDEIQSYDSEEGIVSVSFIRIHIGEDFSRWLIKGLRYNELDAEMTITHMQCVIGEATEESVANITPEAVNFIVYATRGEEKDLEVGHFNLRTQL